MELVCMRRTCSVLAVLLALAAQATASPTRVRYRSVGTHEGVASSKGYASTEAGSNVVTFTSAILPPPHALGTIGTGDKLTIDNERTS